MNARFLELLPRRRELSMEIFGCSHGLSASRLFVLLALCEAEIPSKAAVQAMARELPLDFPVRRVRSMRHLRRLGPVLLKLMKRGTVQQVERDGIACYEPVALVCHTLSAPAGSDLDSPGDSKP